MHTGALCVDFPPLVCLELPCLSNTNSFSFHCGELKDSSLLETSIFIGKKYKKEGKIKEAFSIWLQSRLHYCIHTDKYAWCNACSRGTQFFCSESLLKCIFRLTFK